MATLKSIKNKYLDADDGTVLGVTTNVENVSLLAFKLATADSISKFNLVDGFSDDYNDATGVDTSGSTNEDRNASNYYSGIIEGSYNYDAFTSTGAATWTCPSNTLVAEVLVVAGGGGGTNQHYAGGAGAGGIVHDADYTTVPAVVYDLTVGIAGIVGTVGGDSVWNINAEGSGIAFTAKGGGRGGGAGGTGSSGGGEGGSGGGNDNDNSGGTGGATNQADFAGATSYGSVGGARSSMGEAGGGGGGATATPGTTGPQSPGNASNGIPGGAGKLFSNFTAYGTTSANVASSGSDGGYFGGGGGGGAYTGTPGSKGGIGGVGGGGKGGGQGPSTISIVGMANTGGGGGSAGGTHSGGSGEGQAGGTGIIILRHRALSYNDMTLLSEAYTAVAEPDTARIIMDEYTSTGSATVNTDIKAYASRDGGTTYTQITSLASQGTIETNHRLLSGSVDISGQPSGTSVKYKITTHNQSVSKQTRVYGTSMAWA